MRPIRLRTDSQTLRHSPATTTNSKRCESHPNTSDVETERSFLRSKMNSKMNNNKRASFEPSFEEQPAKRQKSPTSFHAEGGDAPVVVDLISNLPPAPKYFDTSGCSHMDRWGSMFCMLVDFKKQNPSKDPKKAEEYRGRK